MLDEVLFFEIVREAAEGLDAVACVEVGDEPGRFRIQLRDLLPGDREPWTVDVARRELVHPLFGNRCGCVELSLPLVAVQPYQPGYLELASATAAVCLDVQRFCFDAGATWDPDTGQLAIASRMRLRDPGRRVFVDELRDRLRDVAALAYLVSFRLWQLQLRRDQPEVVSDPAIAEVHARLLAALGASPPPTG